MLPGVDETSPAMSAAPKKDPFAKRAAGPQDAPIKGQEGCFPLPARRAKSRWIPRPAKGTVSDAALLRSFAQRSISPTR